MPQVYTRKQFSDYLGEQRAIDDIITFFTSEILPSPTPTPSITPTITPTKTVTPTPTPTISVSVTPTLTQTPTITPTISVSVTPTITPTSTITPTVTRTPTLTPTSTLTPTPSITPTSTPAVPYQTGLLAINCIGNIYTGGVSVSVNGTTVPIVSTGGTIGNGNCVNVMIRDNSTYIYQITYGSGFSGCTAPGFVYDEVRTINFLYNPALGTFGGYTYLEQLYQGGVFVTGNTKQTLIVNPPADLGNGCPTQDLDLVVNFYIEGGFPPTPTPSVTPTLTPTVSITPTITPTTTITPTVTVTPTISLTPTITPTRTLTPTPTISLTPTNTPTPSSTPPPSGTTEANAYLTAVVSAGGTGVTSPISAATVTLFTSLVSNGLYSKIIAMYPLLGGNAAGCKFNAVNPLDTNAAYRLTYAGGMTFSSSGQTSNGVNGIGTTYINSTVAPTLRAMGTYSLNQDTIGAGDILEPAGVSYLVSSASGGSPRRSLFQFGGGSSAILDPTDGIGFYVGLFTGTTLGPQLYKNGVLVATRAGFGSTAYGTSNLQFPSTTNNTTAFGIFTTELTTSQVSTLSTIVDTYLTSIGRNAYSNQADSYLSAVVAAGGTGITPTISAATRTLFTSLASNNLYDKLSTFYPMLGGNAAGCKFNAKNPLDTNAAYRLTWVGGWGYNASGATGNNVNAFANTFLTGSTLSRTSTHMSYYSLTQSSAGNQIEMGCRSGSGGSGIYSEFSANYIAFGGNYRQYNINCIGLATDSASANSATTGYFVASRTSDSTAYLYKNGSLNLSGTTATNGTIPFSFYLNATNDNGTPNTYSAKQIGFASLGNGLTPSEINTLSTIVNTWATAIGRNTY
jgi:hypothetical protein